MTNGNKSRRRRKNSYLHKMHSRVIKTFSKARFRRKVAWQNLRECDVIRGPEPVGEEDPERSTPEDTTTANETSADIVHLSPSGDPELDDNSSQHVTPTDQPQTTEYPSRSELNSESDPKISKANGALKRKASSEGDGGSTDDTAPEPKKPQSER